MNKHIYFYTENSQVFNFRYSIPNNSKPASIIHASLLLNIKCQVTFVSTVRMSCIRPVPTANFCPQLQKSVFIHFFPILPLYNNSTLYVRFVYSTNYLTYLRQLTPFLSSNRYKFTYQHIMIRYPARCARPAVTFCLTII